MSKKIIKELKEALDNVVEIGVEINTLEQEERKIRDKLKSLRESISGHGRANDSSKFVNKINEAIDTSYDFQKAVDNDALIHEGYKISIPKHERYVDGSIVVQKVFMIAEESNNEM